MRWLLWARGDTALMFSSSGSRVHGAGLTFDEPHFKVHVGGRELRSRYLTLLSSFHVAWCSW